MKRLFFIVVSGVIGFYGLSFALNEFSYENAKSLANEYISNSSFDENWKDTHPHVEGEGKYFYTDAETPSYVEFKVSCDNTPDCGFVLVNFDGDDVSIPIASTSGNTPSEVLAAKNGSDITDNKLYYFNPFEQYAENELTGDIASIDPQDDFGDEVSGSGNITPEVKKSKKAKKNKSLKDKIVKAKSEAKEFKKSDDFKKKRKELKDQKQTNGKEEVSFKYLDMNNALAGYTLPTPSNKFVIGNGIYTEGTKTCYGQVPCYMQTAVTYNGATCNTGCTPVAYGMIYGYYDRMNVATSLLTGTASTFNTGNVITMIETLGKTYLSTTCSGSLGLTTASNSIKGINYAIAKGYGKSSANVFTGTTYNLYTNYIKTNIDVSRPIIVNTNTHSMVAYGYYNNPNSPTIKTIRVNLGSGPNYTVISDIGGVYYGSNIDYNIDSIYYDGANKGAIKSVIQIILAK